MNIGLSEAGLIQILSIIEKNVGKKEADAGRPVLSKVLKKSANAENPVNADFSRRFLFQDLFFLLHILLERIQFPIFSLTVAFGVI
jgi:hypothetical protein